MKRNVRRPVRTGDFLDHTVSYVRPGIPLGGGTNSALCVTPINSDQAVSSQLRTG